MSITLHNYPQDFEPTFSDMWFRISSTNVVKPNFHFVFDTYTINLTGGSSTTKVNRSKLPPRPDSYCVYSPSDVLSNYVRWDFDVYAQGFRGAMNSCVGYELRFGEEYDITGTTHSYSSITNSSSYVQIDFNSPHGFVSGDLIKINPANPVYNPTYTGLKTIISVPSSTSIVLNEPYINSGYTESGECVYRLTMSTGVTFTGIAMNIARQYTEINRDFEEDYRIGLNKGSPLSNTVDTQWIEIARNESFLLSWLADPGIYPTSMFVLTEDINGNLNGLFQIGCYLSGTPEYIRFDFGAGPKNLDYHAVNLLAPLSGSVDIISSDVYSYKVVPGYLSAGTASAQQFGEYRRFKIIEACNPNRTRLGFVNRLGGIDMFSFAGYSRKLVVTKDLYRKNLDWNYTIGDRGEVVLNNNVVEEYTVYTSWLTEQEANFIEILITSPEVYKIEDDNDWILPVIITNNEFITKSTEDGELIMYTITYRFANNIKLQRN